MKSFLLLPLLIAFVAIGLGILRLFRVYAIPNVVRGVFVFTLGLGVYSIVLFCFLWAGLTLSPALVWIIAGGLMTLFWLLPLGQNVQRNGAEASVQWGPTTPLGKTLCAISVLFIILIIALPVFGPLRGWDAYYYHIPVSREIFQEKALPAVVSPSYQEMVRAYPPLIYLANATSFAVAGFPTLLFPKFLHVFFGFGILLLMFAAMQTVFRRNVNEAYGAIVIFLSTELAFTQFLEEGFDYAFTFYAMAGVFFLLRALRSPTRANCVVSALFLALAAWTKPHGLLFLALVVVLLVFLRFLRRPWALSFRSQALIGITAVVLASPFLIRNWIVFDNPIYPSLSGLFGGVGISRWSETFVSPFTSPRLFYAFDWTVLFHTATLPILLLFVFLIVKRGFMREERMLSILGITYAVLWIAVMRAPHSGYERFLLPAVVGAAMLGGPTLVRLLEERISRRSELLLPATFLLGAGIVTLGLTPLPTKNLAGIIYALFVDHHLFLIGLALVILAFVPRRWKQILPLLTILFFFLVVGRSLAFFGSQVWRDLRARLNSAEIAQIPQLEPESGWMAAHLPEGARILSFEPRRAQLSHTIVPADAPSFEPIYETDNVCNTLAVLKRERIDAVYVNGSTDILHPLFGRSPVFTERRNRKYFQPLFQDSAHPWLLIYTVQTGACS